MKFELDQRLPDESESPTANDFWSVNQMLGATDYDTMVANEDNIVLENGEREFNAKIVDFDEEALELTAHTSDFGLVQDFSPHNYCHRSDEGFYEMMTVYSFLMETTELNPDYFPSTHDNPRRLWDRVRPFDIRGVLENLEREGFYEPGDREHVGSIRGKDIASDLNDRLNRLWNNGVIGYNTEFQNGALEIDSGGYKFLSEDKLPDNAPYSTTKEAINYRFDNA